MPIYLLSIAELSLDSLEAELFQIIQPQLQSKQVEYTYRFFLSCKAFSALGKLFFQDYMKTRNLGYFLGQIQL